MYLVDYDEPNLIEDILTVYSGFINKNIEPLTIGILGILFVFACWVIVHLHEKQKEKILKLNVKVFPLGPRGRLLHRRRPPRRHRVRQAQLPFRGVRRRGS